MERGPDGQPRISYGVIVENGSRDLAANHLKLRIELRDSSGTPLTFRMDDAEPGIEANHSAWLSAGEQMGFGGYARLVVPAGSRVPKAVTVYAKVTVKWWVEACGYGMRHIGVSDPQTSRKGHTATVRFTADVPSWCPYIALPRTSTLLYSVYYDENGEIVGGDALDLQRHETEFDDTGHPGRVTATGRIPAVADPDRTEVYANEGCGGPQATASPTS